MVRWHPGPLLLPSFHNETPQHPVALSKAHQTTVEGRKVSRRNLLHFEVDIINCSPLGCRQIKSKHYTEAACRTKIANTHIKSHLLLLYYMSNSMCDPGLPCIIRARSRRDKAVPSALRAMLEHPKVITINQAESIEGIGEDRNCANCQVRLKSLQILWDREHDLSSQEATLRDTVTGVLLKLLRCKNSGAKQISKRCKIFTVLISIYTDCRYWL